MPVRVLIEAFKLYKSVMCILGRNLLLEQVAVFDLTGGPTDDNKNDIEIYRYAIVGFEVLSFVVMCLTLKFVKKTIEVFGINEFDLV